VNRHVGNDWVQIGDNIDVKTTSDHLGYFASTSDDENTIAIGGNENDWNSSDFRHVRVYRHFESD